MPPHTFVDGKLQHPLKENNPYLPYLDPSYAATRAQSRPAAARPAARPPTSTDQHHQHHHHHHHGDSPSPGPGHSIKDSPSHSQSYGKKDGHSQGHGKDSHSHGNRPRRRRISHIPGPDPVDLLGAIGSPYHHDGPFEATLLARQVPGRAPVDAVRDSNAAALAATPPASIRDCLDAHYPLQGVAMYPPDVGGTGNYAEYDVMVRDGAYKRWAHLHYRDDDRKGKGEPSFTADELDKRRKEDRRRRGGPRAEAGEGVEAGIETKEHKQHKRQEAAGAAAATGGGPVAPSRPGGGGLSRLKNKVHNSLKESGRL